MYSIVLDTYDKLSKSIFIARCTTVVSNPGYGIHIAESCYVHLSSACFYGFLLWHGYLHYCSISSGVPGRVDCTRATDEATGQAGLA